MFHQLRSARSGRLIRTIVITEFICGGVQIDIQLHTYNCQPASERPDAMLSEQKDTCTVRVDARIKRHTYGHGAEAYAYTVHKPHADTSVQGYRHTVQETHAPYGVQIDRRTVYPQVYAYGV
jgi:hypothetical protein